MVEAMIVPPMAIVDSHASAFFRRSRLRWRLALPSHSAERGGEVRSLWGWQRSTGAWCAGDKVRAAGCDSIAGGERMGAELGSPDCVDPFSGSTPT